MRGRGKPGTRGRTKTPRPKTENRSLTFAARYARLYRAANVRERFLSLYQNVSLPEICNWRGPQIRLLVEVVARYGVEV